MTSAWTAQATPLPAASDDLAGERVARRGRLVDVDGGDVGPVVERGSVRSPSRLASAASAAGDGRARGDRLEAAAQAARAARAGGVDDDVADLAGEAAGAAMERGRRGRRPP